MPDSPQNFDSALNRLVTDAGYRQAVADGQAILKDDFGLSDDQLDLLRQIAKAADWAEEDPNSPNTCW